MRYSHLGDGRAAALAPAETPGPALGILELAHIARGVVVADALLKRAEVELFASRPVSSGKHLVMLAGDVESVGYSMEAGAEAATGALVDRLEVPFLDASLWGFLGEPVHPAEWPSGPVGAVLLVESKTVCGAICAADRALKSAEVAVRDMRLALGIDGKAFFSMTGELPDIEAAADAARDAAGDRLIALELIAQPAEELIGRLIFG